MVAFQRITTRTASVVETAALQPARTDRAAAALIARTTTRSRPKRCAVSLPVTETRTPTNPATVNSVVGVGSHSGAPCHAIAAAKNVTPHARNTAISQVWTV